MKLLLHCCCAPCSISCVSYLKSENINFDIFWFNPNIQPEDEYNKRFFYLEKFAKEKKLNLLIYDNLSYSSVMLKIKNCNDCYRIRLKKTAEYAAQNGFDAFTTTLLISPYQDHEAIKRIGEEIAAMHNVSFLYRDFRPLFREGQKEARALGFYMQKYCGCGREEINSLALKGGVLNPSARIKKSNSENIHFKDFNPKPHLSIPGSIFNRVELLVFSEGLKKLRQTRVIIFGAGGVGSWCAEALVRSGIGKIDIVDFDKVEISNINRQLQATSKTIGMDKAIALKHRLLEINPDCEITAHAQMFSKVTCESFNIADFNYVIDAIDMLANKLDLIETVFNSGVKLFSCMGMALKTDPLKIKTASIWKTDACPLARLVRQGLRKRGFTGDFLTVFSEEIQTQRTPKNAENTKRVNGSIVTVTANAGFLLANLIINDVLKSVNTDRLPFQSL